MDWRNQIDFNAVTLVRLLHFLKQVSFLLIVSRGVGRLERRLELQMVRVQNGFTTFGWFHRVEQCVDADLSQTKLCLLRGHQSGQVVRSQTQTVRLKMVKRADSQPANAPQRQANH